MKWELVIIRQEGIMKIKRKFFILAALFLWSACGQIQDSELHNTVTTIESGRGLEEDMQEIADEVWETYETIDLSTEKDIAEPDASEKLEEIKETGKTKASESEQTTEVVPALTLGAVNNGNYENSSLGIGFELQDWNMSTEEEIAEINGIARELYGETLQKAIEDIDSLTPLLAKSPDEMQNVNMHVQRISLKESILVGELSEDKLVDGMLSMVSETVEETMGAIGYQNISVKRSEAMFLGEKHYIILTTAEIMGMKAFQKQVILILPGYSVVISTTSIGTDDTDAILGRFYKL